MELADEDDSSETCERSDRLGLCFSKLKDGNKYKEQAQHVCKGAPSKRTLLLVPSRLHTLTIFYPNTAPTGRVDGSTLKPKKGCEVRAFINFRGQLGMSGSNIYEHNFVQSMSSNDNYWDNVVADHSIKSLKTEVVSDAVLISSCNMPLAVFEHIEIYYNRIRRHSTIGYISPIALEKRRETALAKRHTRIKLRQNTVVI